MVLSNFNWRYIMGRTRETQQQVLGRQIPDNQQGNTYKGANKPKKMKKK